MMVELSNEQREALKAQGHSPLYLLNPEDGAWYVLLPAGEYRRMTEQSGEFDIRETYTLQEQVAGAEGWDQPSMDDYNDYDAHQRPT
ncbi:MAG: hypothetical protein ABFD16_09105 [Thermoguttaceae bacterium]